MDENTQSLEDYISIVKRRKWQFLLPALVLLLIALLAALLIPAVYRSSATILIERQEIPPDLVRTTVTSYADQRIQVISQRVMTTSNLSALIERYNLYADLRRKESINAAVEEMKEKMDLNMISADVLDPRSGKPQEATIAFSLSFENQSPELAQKVTSDLVSLFLNENLQQRTAAANEATTFLQAEAARLGSEINELEARLALFKEEHRDNLPELASINRESLLRSEERLRDNAQSIRALDQQILYLESSLAQLSPTFAGNGSMTHPNSLAAHLEELRAKYVRVKERYSPSHPDRIQMEKEIAALQKQLGQSNVQAIQSRLTDLETELSSLKRRYSENHPDVVALERSIANTRSELSSAKERAGAGGLGAEETTNPAYVELHAKLEAAQAESASLKESREQIKSQIASYEKRITEAPRIEQEYRALTRDYENAMSKYREVREKSLQAEMAQALERDRKSERFSLIEPPLVPEKPFKPNRLAIIVLGFVLAIGGGVGNLALRESLDKGLCGPRSIQMATKMPLLAVVPYIETPADKQLRQRKARLIMGAGVAGVLVVVVFVHLAVIPLDVLWFVVMRRFDASIPGLTN